jgi:hypothetical protein
MQHFCSDIKNRHRFMSDEEGVLLSDIEAAQLEAAQAIAEMSRDGL